MWPFTRRKPKRPRWDLSEKLLAWSSHDDWLDLNAACQGIQVWGSTGSGKSTSTLAAIAGSYLDTGMGGTFLCSKPEDRHTFESYVRSAGREKDLILFGPTHPLTYNFIGEELARKDTRVGAATNIAATLLAVSRAIQGQSKHAGDRQDPFWSDAKGQALKSGLELLVVSDETVTIENLRRLLVSAPKSREDIDSEKWQRESFFYRCAVGARGTSKTPSQDLDNRAVLDYFFLEWATLSERMRGTILLSITATLDPFTRGAVRDILCAPQSTVHPSMMHDGAIIIVDAPVLVYGELGRVISTVWKSACQRVQSRRDVSQNKRPVFLIADEAHLHAAIETDAAFQTTARSTRTCVVYVTQSITNYLSACGGELSESAVYSLLGSLQTQVFHQQSDVRTISYCQELIGRSPRLLLNGGNSQQGEDWVGALLGQRQQRSSNAGFSYSMEYELNAQDLNALAKGGPPDFIAEAILYQGGKRFTATGKSWMPVRIRQTFV